MSPLRIGGILVALALGYMVLHRLSRRAPTAADGFGFIAALVLLLVSLFPWLANLPTEFLRLGASPRRRLFMLLVVSNLVLWVYTVWSSDQRRRRQEAAAEQMEALVARISAHTAPSEIDGVAIIMPAYNEDESVAQVIAGLPKQILGLPVQPIVVADGCTDQTAAVAKRAGAAVLDLPINMGGGAAIRIGYNYAAHAGARAVVTMDADGQHKADDIPRLLQPILDGDADFVVGSRQLGSFERVSAMRSMGLSFFNFFLNLLLATHLTDCSSGFRAFDVHRLRHLETSESQYHTAETIMLVRRQGLRIAEVPITVQRRIAGQSKKGNDFVYGYRFARSMLSRWLRG
ncbi:MAG: glycosyltransferase family 2 protein [Thermaerobacter sp.]|nr:glycosyltransferase family 2 protein [Thermaerobacter sp.]